MDQGASSRAQTVSSNISTIAESREAPPSKPPKKKKRGGKKRRNRRESFAAPPESLDGGDMTSEARPSLVNAEDVERARSSFYRLRGNRSNTSLESEALLDHRDQGPIRTRRQSLQSNNLFTPRTTQSFAQRGSPQYSAIQNPFDRSKLSTQHNINSDSGEDDGDDRTPLMSRSYRDVRDHRPSGYGGTTSAPSSAGRTHAQRRRSISSGSSTRRRPAFASHRTNSQTNILDGYDVNNPPSVPASPVLGPEGGYDVMLTGDLERGISADNGRSSSRDALIDIDNGPSQMPESTPPSPGPTTGELRRRMTAMQAADDVCFPHEGMSEIGLEDALHRLEAGDTRRRRRREWPKLEVLEEWSREEKMQMSMETIRARQVSEPLMVGGRLRPQKRVWHREADDAPYRFTYFNEEFQSTIHSQTISELVQPGQTFRDLFIPDPPLLEDSSDESEEEDASPNNRTTPHERAHSLNGNPSSLSRKPSRLSDVKESGDEQARAPSISQGPTPTGRTPTPRQKEKRYGPRPAFWLDVLSPTEAEMKVISKAFSIHPLTTEDIMMQEAREKVELFRNYYFVNYRTFEQDQNNEDYLEPLNMYMVVFRDGVISFHFSMTPHPANVRRRIRQLKDYLILSADWISYGIIDDITDAYAPLIERIEEEVDEIDDAILRLHSEDSDDEQDPEKSGGKNWDEKSQASSVRQESGHNMLRRVGECRKKVMSLYRLLGNKADVIKGFAKRCNEQWNVAPRSEIGLYLGDIQDHIVTMTGNLSHYENLLSRAHSNYLAQINIHMNERQEKTSDILGKLTVLGTIVLPMNVVTGIWGMNCLVPGQNISNLNWFFGITGSLILFGLTSYFIAKRVYGIV
ncbi:cora-domain-containing protein [Delitschia confertaspora ATCC 74209]|uniref:Cora-domain-containing protein n=1 Tax=Delitschia confertaspora ATCC 74209 TaxID=1513339 RepID=A0A9P4JYW4_9PLEO|nr:cora-domain-containing protein [Delitschia confertaspora ATCC 74209]